MQEFTLVSLAYAVSGAANSDADIARVMSMPKIVFTMNRVVALCFVTHVIFLLISFLSVVSQARLYYILFDCYYVCRFSCVFICMFDSI